MPKMDASLTGVGSTRSGHRVESPWLILNAPP